MAIHLVGETIDAKRAHQRAQAGALVQLVRGIYVEQDVDADAAILSEPTAAFFYAEDSLDGLRRAWRSHPSAPGADRNNKAHAR